MFNPNNRSTFNAIKNSIEVQKRNNVPGIESIKLINSKPFRLKQNLAMKKYRLKKPRFAMQMLQVIFTI